MAPFLSSMPLDKNVRKIENNGEEGQFQGGCVVPPEWHAMMVGKENGGKKESCGKKKCDDREEGWEYYSIVPQFSDTSAHGLPLCSVRVTCFFHHHLNGSPSSTLFKSSL